MNQTIAFGVIEVIVTVPESDAGLRLRTLFTNLLLVLNCDVDEGEPWDLNVNKNIAIVIYAWISSWILLTHGLRLDVF